MNKQQTPEQRDENRGCWQLPEIAGGKRWEAELGAKRVIVMVSCCLLRKWRWSRSKTHILKKMPLCFHSQPTDEGPHLHFMGGTLPCLSAQLVTNPRGLRCRLEMGCQWRGELGTGSALLLSRAFSC